MQDILSDASEHVSECTADPYSPIKSADQSKLLGEYIRQGLSLWEFRPALRKSISTECNLDENMAKVLFTQVLIFLWLTEIKPQGHKVRFSSLILLAWSIFRSYKKDYETFIVAVSGYIIDQRHTEGGTLWLCSIESIAAFVDDPNFSQWCWETSE